MKSRNFYSTLISFITPEVANTEFSVAHGLNTIPAGAFVVLSNPLTALYISGTAWTSTQAYFKSNITRSQFTVLFFV